MPFSPHPFSLRQLQYAVALAELLSFRKAAERCHVSQPSLSAQLAQLEGALGARLFERDRRGVLLTAAGGVLIARAREVLRESDHLLALARESSDPLTGTLRLGVIPTISPYFLPQLSPALRQAFPRLALLWVEERTDQLTRKLAAGEIDAALLALEADIGELEHEVVGSDAFVLATPRGHPLGEAAGPARPRELRGASVLLLDDGHCLREQALAYCAGAKAHELEFRATSLSTLAQMVADGAGVTLLPELALPTEAKRAELTLRRFADPPPHRTLALVWRRRSSLDAALRQLTAVARRAYREREGARPLAQRAAAATTGRTSRPRKRRAAPRPAP